MRGGAEIMKKIFALLLCLFASAIVFAASQTPVYVDTEQKYVFSVDNLSQTIPEFVEDTAKQDAMAAKYLELANKETGAVSVKDLFEICEAGGFKTRRAEGYESCRNFVVKLLETVEQELEDGTLTGYCPGLDENGKNPNRLKSITGETRVGDFCSSSNIAAGEVVFKKGYNCTCAAYACNNCCESIGGACLTKVADSNGNCLRKEYDNVPNLNVEGAALKFCESKAQRGCKVFSALRNYPSPGKVVCNGTEEERSAVRALSTPCPDTAYAFTNENNTLEKCRSFCIGKAKENSCKSVNVVHSPVKNECICNPDKETVRRLNMKYYQVCGKDKGKSGGSIEECLRVFTNKVYGGTQVDVSSAIILAKEWARVNKYREIECDTKIYDYSALEDSILCSSIDKDKNGKRGYFEFVFDDLRESSTATIERTFWNALFGRIYGYEQLNYLNTQHAFATGTESVCKNTVGPIAKKYCSNCITQWAKGSTVGKGDKWFCYIKKEVLNLANVTNNDFDIDPFVFCKGAQSQLQGSSGAETLLKQYISSNTKYPISKIDCGLTLDYYCGDSKAGSPVCKCDASNLVNYDPRDDIKTCIVHGDKDYYIRFVFDDFAELSKKREKGALQSMGCVVSGGTFNGQECKFANKSQCDTYIKSMSKVCPQCTKPKWNPDTGLCEVPDAAAVTAMEKREKRLMIIGGVVASVVVTVATAGTGAPAIAFVLSGIEVAGGAMEYFAQHHIDAMAHEFFLKSAKCNNASCAEEMIKENMQEMANIQNDLEDFEINALDAEFERLLGLIEPSSDFYMRIAEKGTSLQDNQKGFFDPDSWNEAQVWRAIGIGLQFLSLGTGVITKIIQGPKFANKFPKMQAMLLKQVKISKKIKDTKKVTSAVEMSAGQAKRLDELDGKIATLESKTNRSAAEADELKKLRQERNELKNKIGTKDADELDKAKNAAFDKKAVETANKEYDTAKQRYDHVRQYMAEHNGNPPERTDKYAVQKINNDMAAAEKKLKDLGQDVEPVEPLQIGKKPTVEPETTKPVDNTEKATEPKSTEPKPAESGTNPKETNGEPKLADDLLIDMSDNVNQSRLMAGKLNKTELAKLRKHYPDLDDLALQQKAKEIGQEISKQKIANGGFLDSEVRAMNDATRNANNVDNVATGAKTTQKGATNASKSQKIAEARQRGDLGYHGTDADISMDDMIRSSANSSDRLGSVGYGVARDYDAAEKYAVKRLVERQNVGKNITFYREGDVLVVKSDETLNLSNKTGYVYTTAKEPSVKWETLRNGYVGAFDAAQMPHSVEVLDKKVFNLDDLVRQGRVKIIEPEATKATSATSAVSKPAGKIIEESKTMTRQERQSLLSTLSEEKKLEIARLKIGAGEVKLPFGSTIDDLAKNPDLLDLRGEYLPLNQQGMRLSAQIKRFDNLADKLKRTGLSTDELAEYNQVLKNGGRESLVSELRYTLSNDISLDALVANAQQYERVLLGVIKSDSKMARQAQNFSKLSKAEQEVFLNNIVKGLDDYFHAGVKPQVKLVDSWTEIGVSAEKDISSIGLSRDNVIYIKPSNLHLNGMDGDLNNVMSLIAHEYGHAMDGASAEKVAIGGNATAKNIIGNPGSKVAKTLKDNMEYVATPTEKSSFATTTVVGENFAKDLEATLKTGKVTTSSLTDLQKYKIMTGFVGDKIKTADKFGVKYYTISSKTADNIWTVMDHFRKVGIEHMTIFEENGEHVLAVFDNASDMKRFEQQIAKSTSNKIDNVADAGKAANKADNVASGASKASTNVSSGKKMYSPTFIDGNVYKPTTIPEQSDSVWELTEVAPNKYQITVYKDAEKRILANPAFLEGANKQVMGWNRVELIEPGIAEMDAVTGKLRVTKVPEVWLVENASTAAKTVNKVDDVADASKGVKPTKTAGKAVSKADDVAVIETPVEEANKLFNIYGLSLENINGLEIPMSRFGNGEKTVNELARLVEKKGGYLQQIGDKIVVRKPGKTGWDLRQSLKEHGIISNRYASDAFHEIHIRSGDQCVSGLKFHVSVNVEDLENASYIVDDLVRRTDVADIWKVYSDGMTGTQKGKDFTIYVSQNGYNSDKIQGFLQELENELKARNIRPNGYGNNIVTGDKPVSGSNYMYYRYDRINASGIPDGEYNSSYNFIAPNAQYGGDIMNGIKVGF